MHRLCWLSSEAGDTILHCPLLHRHNSIAQRSVSGRAAVFSPKRDMFPLASMPLHILWHKGDKVRDVCTSEGSGKGAKDRLNSCRSHLVCRWQCASQCLPACSEQTQSWWWWWLNSGARKHKIAHNAYSKCAQLTLLTAGGLQGHIHLPLHYGPLMRKMDMLAGPLNTVPSCGAHCPTLWHCLTANTANTFTVRCSLFSSDHWGPGND